jgi:hypothetical protein
MGSWVAPGICFCFKNYLSIKVLLTLTGEANGMRSLGAADETEPVCIAVCCLMIILALVGGVGLTSGLVLHHLVQTLPLWA